MVDAVDPGGSRDLAEEDGASDAMSTGDVDVGARAGAARDSRKARRDPDVDPMRGRVLYQLTAMAYFAEHGVWPRPIDLNRRFPASAAGPQKSGAWNRMQAGDGLARSIAAPQGLLMQGLTAAYPKVAASCSWPIWRLSSRWPLTMPEIHGLMVQLPDGIRHMLIGSYRNGRYLRFPTDPRDEVGFMMREKSLGGLSALIAIMREAELKQDPLTHGDAYRAMLDHLPVLEEAFGAPTLGQEFAAYLRHRFESMEFIVPGAYSAMPGSDAVVEPAARFMLPHRLDHEAALRFHAEWLGLPPEVLEEVLRARRDAEAGLPPVPLEGDGK